MRTLFITIAIIVCFSTIHAQRGRVQIQNGTVVTDRGTLLRGACFSTDFSDYIPSEAEIEGIKDIGLNSLHLYAECAVNSDFAGQKAEAVDSIVNMTGRDSLYLVITIGNCGDEGSFDSAFVNDFWKFYAPRYKDRTHVIFEIMNEPFPWSSPYDSLTLAMERQAYDIIRYYAPETHVLFMSYSWPINADSVILDIKQLGDVDWNNASIASHAYMSGPEELRPFINTIADSGYAVTFTEPGSVGNEYINLASTRIFEEEFASYLHFLYIPEILDNPAIYQSPIESSEIRWTPDFGTWPASLSGINYKDPYQRFEAAFYDGGWGFKVLWGTTTLGYINNNDYVAYYNFDFEEGPDSILLECSAGNLDVSSGRVELIIDSLNGTLIGTYPIPYTENWDDYHIFRFPITVDFESVHKFYFVFKGEYEWDLMSLRSIQFKKEDGLAVPQIAVNDEHALFFPNSASESITFYSEYGLVRIYTLQGILLNEYSISKDGQQIDLVDFTPGNYIVVQAEENQIKTTLLTIR